MRLTLQQIKDLHKAEGCDPLSVTVKGHVEAIVRNADGTIDQIISKPNLTSSLWDHHWHVQPNLRNMKVFILPDDNGDVHPLRTYARHLYPNNYAVSSEASVNTSTYTWTYSAVFGPPSSNRNIRYIGLNSFGNSGDVGSDGNARVVHCIFAMTKLTSNILQTTSQTLEIAYRVSFSRT